MNKYTFCFLAWSIFSTVAYFQGKLAIAILVSLVGLLHAVWVIAENTDLKNRK